MPDGFLFLGDLYLCARQMPGSLAITCKIEKDTIGFLHSIEKHVCKKMQKYAQYLEISVDTLQIFVYIREWKSVSFSVFCAFFFSMMKRPR